MPVSLRAELRGGRAFERAIRRLQRPERDPIDRRAFRRMAERLRDRTREGYLSGGLLRRITGELWDSIEIDDSGLPEAITVGSSLVQADVLHEGTKASMPRRPFLELGLDDVVRQFPDIWVEELERGIR